MHDKYITAKDLNTYKFFLNLSGWKMLLWFLYNHSNTATV